MSGVLRNSAHAPASSAKLKLWIAQTGLSSPLSANTLTTTVGARHEGNVFRVFQGYVNPHNGSPMVIPEFGTIPAGSVSPGSLGPLSSTGVAEDSRSLKTSFSREAGPYSIFGEALLSFGSVGESTFIFEVIAPATP